MPHRLCALIVTFVLAVSVPQPGMAQSELEKHVRHFTFHYGFTVKNVSPGERVRVWIPLAHSDAFQEVKVTAKSGDLALKQVPQPEYGNVVLYAETAKADREEYKFSVDYDVVRREHRVLVNGQPAPQDGPLHPVPKVELARYLKADRLVPVTGVPADLAVEPEARRRVQRAHAPSLLARHAGLDGFARHPVEPEQPQVVRVAGLNRAH